MQPGVRDKNSQYFSRDGWDVLGDVPVMASYPTIYVFIVEVSDV